MEGCSLDYFVGTYNDGIQTVMAGMELLAAGNTWEYATDNIAVTTDTYEAVKMNILPCDLIVCDASHTAAAVADPVVP